MDTSEPNLKHKLHNETALISWHELQRFFAQGAVVVVDASLDLVEIATFFAEDSVDKLQQYTESGAVAAPSNDKARDWYSANSELWSVVVAPYVLVQEREKP